MKFRFLLETILRLRRSEQRQQELILLRATDEVRFLEGLAGAAGAEITDIFRAPANNGAELQFREQRLRVAYHRQAALHAELEEARDRQAHAAAELKKVWQKHEALETVRQRKKNEHTLAEERRDQRVQDDLFLRNRAQPVSDAE